MASCKKIFTLPQISHGGTCWFNALLSALFYSDGTSAYFKKVLPSLRKKTKSKKKLEIFDILDQLLKARDIKDVREFSKFYAALEPKNILKVLHEKDKKHFFFNPDKQRGYNSETYMIMLFQFLGIMDKVLFVSMMNGKYYYDAINSEMIEGKWDAANKQYKALKQIKSRKRIFDEIDFNKIDILIASESSMFRRPRARLHCKFSDDAVNIFGVDFKSDSLLLSNFNRDACNKGHKIAGVTCKGKRYLYNGWANMRDEKNFIIPRKSCGLFTFDWMKENSHFCMDDHKCVISKVKKTPHQKMCFNTKKKRTFIYVNPSSITENKPKKQLVKKPVKKVVKKPESQDIKLVNLLKKPERVKRPRCPNGTRRDTKTGECLKKSK